VPSAGLADDNRRHTVPPMNLTSILTESAQREPDHVAVKVNIFQGVPTMYGGMLHYPDREKFDTSTLQLCASGGSAMPVELLREFEQAFGCKILEGYGLSESSPVASLNHANHRRKPGSIGTPIAGVEMKIVDDLPKGPTGKILKREIELPDEG
jgi:long-chain acyl-CoA synthetase